MLGAIAGDIIGSIYERNSIKSKQFELFSSNNFFTDDTVLTVAIAKSIINHENYIDNIIYFGLKYYDVDYGSSFRKWQKMVKLKKKLELSLVKSLIITLTEQ